MHPVLRLSIVIPLLGDQRLLDDTLVSVLENRPDDCEVVVVHNAPYDDPYDLAGEVRFVRAAPRAGFADCVNLGVSVSRAAVVHVLACGVEATAGWADVALARFRDPRIAAVAPLLVAGADPQTVVSAGVGYRAEGVAWRLGPDADRERPLDESDGLCGPDLLAGFYRRSAVESVGGFSPFAVKLAAVDMAMRLQDAGCQCVAEPKSLAYVAVGTMEERPGFRHGRDAERLFWRWATAQGALPSVAAHAALLAGECVIGLWRPSMLLNLAGRAAGAIGAAVGTGRRKAMDCQAADEPSVIRSPRLLPTDDTIGTEAEPSLQGGGQAVTPSRECPSRRAA
jgi:GT2 family glycosyltransferase